MIRRQTVEPVFVTLVVSLALIVGSHDAAARGCIKGAAVGAVAGHVAGHHAVVGAVAGCAIGHHVAKKKQQQLRQQQSTTPAQPTPAPDSGASHA
jgi:outer membrane lipoprotein SlyB